METERLNMLIDIVMRQTDYSNEEASKKMIEHKYNVLAVVREFIGSDVNVNVKKEDEPTKPTKSTNQLIYGEIRNMMGNAAANYRRKQELQQYYNSKMHHAKQEEKKE